MGFASGDVVREVSVIIPTYNCRAFVAEAIVSVLSQSERARQIIVVDDGSVDGTAECLRRFFGSISLIRRNQCRGVSAARNVGLRCATGEWVLFLDADDRLAADSLRCLVKRGTENPNGVAYGHRREIDEQGAVIRECRARDCTGIPPRAGRTSFWASAFPPGSAIVPRHIALEIGGFDERFSTCADRHFWVRCGAITEFLPCEEVVFEYRRRRLSMSSDPVLHAVEQVLVQIDALRWCRSRGINLFDPEPRPEELLSRLLIDHYWARHWNCVDALLALARRLSLSNKDIQWVQRRRRLGRWIIGVKDCFDLAIDGVRSPWSAKTS
jgi:glycosyltransferase involved in cell wall biosynthesis